MLIGLQEYLVTDIKKVAGFIDEEIGVDYELTELDSNPEAGSVVVFELTEGDHKLIRSFIDNEDLWDESYDDY